MKHLISIIFVCITITSCSTQIPESKNRIDYSSITNNSLRGDVIAQTIYIDTIVIPMGDNENELSSMEGDFFLKNDSIYFADRNITRLFVYDQNGKLCKTTIQRGRGHNEIISLFDITQLSDGSGYAILGSNFDVYVFDNAFELKNKFNINWGEWESQKNFNDIVKNPDPNLLIIYELTYSFNKTRSLNNKYMLFPIVTDHINYNGFTSGTHAEHFYKNSYSLGILDLENQKMDMMINRSPIYEQYRYLARFKDIVIETNNDTLYYTFEADSLIYKYNLKDSTLVSFGLEGVQMNAKYKETNTYKEAEKLRKTEFGFYTDLSYISATSTLFRSYNKGEPTNQTGLQVYRNQKLIGDFVVPNNFNVIGYVEPYYYGYGEHNYDTGDMYIYKFIL